MAVHRVISIEKLKVNKHLHPEFAAEVLAPSYPHPLLTTSYIAKKNPEGYYKLSGLLILTFPFSHADKFDVILFNCYNF